MDVSELVATASQLFTAGLASSTRRAYRSGAERYLSFCARAHKVPFPASEEVLILYVSQLHKDKLASGTIKTYIAAIRYEQISKGLGDPKTYEMPRLEYVIKGFKKLSPNSQERRLPMTPEILGKLRQVWDRSSQKRDAMMLWAASCLCFFGFLRSGEAVAPSTRQYDPACHLCYEDVKVDSLVAPSALQVLLKASKTDPFRQGVTIHIGKTGD